MLKLYGIVTIVYGELQLIMIFLNKSVNDIRKLLIVEMYNKNIEKI